MWRLEVLSGESCSPCRAKASGVSGFRLPDIVDVDLDVILSVRMIVMVISRVGRNLCDSLPMSVWTCTRRPSNF